MAGITFRRATESTRTLFTCDLMAGITFRRWKASQDCFLGNLKTAHKSQVEFISFSLYMLNKSFELCSTSDMFLVYYIESTLVCDRNMIVSHTKWFETLKPHIWTLH